MEDLNEVQGNPENVEKEDIFGSEDFFNNLDEGAGTDDMVCKIFFDNQIVQSYRVGSSNIYTSPDNTIPVLIPPFTTVKITIKDLTQASTIENIVSLVGRVYA